MKKPVPFTQFLLPDGRQRLTSIEVSEEEYAKYEEIRDAGFRMTCELLTTGEVSMCIEDPELGDLDCVVSANGPDVPAKLRDMFLRFDRTNAAEWRKQTI